MRKPDGSTELRITSHESFTDEEVLEQIRNPADAVAVLEDGNKDVAVWGRRWLTQAKVTAEDRGNVVTALTRCLDTPDAGQRLEVVQLYFRWADRPDEATLLKILRLPATITIAGRRHLSLSSACRPPPPGKSSRSDAMSPPSYLLSSGIWETWERRLCPCSRVWQRISSAAVREAAEGQLNRLGILKETAVAAAEPKPAAESEPMTPPPAKCAGSLATRRIAARRIAACGVEARRFAARGFTGGKRRSPHPLYGRRGPPAVCDSPRRAGKMDDREGPCHDPRHARRRRFMANTSIQSIRSRSVRASFLRPRGTCASRSGRST